MNDSDPEKIILVAMTEDRLIGRGNDIPWHLPAELRLFRELTTGHAVVMGRRTFESIGRPLPQRRNLVVSRTLSDAPGVDICRSLEQALALTGGEEKVFLIGGRQIFCEALPIADRLLISWIKGEYAGDVYFPEIDWSRWQVESEEDYQEFRHLSYRRR